MTLPEQDQTYLRECVATGVAHLDKHEPGWASHIVVNKLDMTSASRCVVGQTCAKYGQPTDAIKHYWESHGFDLDHENLHVLDEDVAWNYLRDLWVEAINARTL